MVMFNVMNINKGSTSLQLPNIQILNECYIGIRGGRKGGRGSIECSLLATRRTGRIYFFLPVTFFC